MFVCICCMDYRKYNKVDIRIVYIIKWEKYRELVYIMRREIIIVCCFFLVNVMICCFKIINCILLLKGIVKKFKNFFGIVVIDISYKYKCLFIKMLLKI